MNNQTHQTQHLLVIRHALLKLMAETPYKDIRVHHIAEQAKVSRNTFYRCYTNKDHIVSEIYDDLMSKMMDDIDKELELYLSDNETKRDVVFNIILAIFTQSFQYLDSSKLLLNSGIDELVYKRFQVFFARLIGKLIRRQNLHIVDNQLMHFFLSHMTGSAFHFIKEWLTSDSPPSPEKMAQLYTEIFRPSLGLIRQLSKESESFIN